MRRKAICKAKHISLAVIRPLSALVPTVLAEMCKSPRPGLFTKDKRGDAEEFLHRVLNQNEQVHGWVYLHPDGDIGIGEPAVAMLRISISLRSEEHYETIRKGRRGRLDTEYRTKFGWLKGNLYSRIDTADWSEKQSGDEEESKIIKDLLHAPVGEAPSTWVSPAWIEGAKMKQVNLAEVPADQLYEVLRQYAPKPNFEVARDQVSKIIANMSVEFTDAPVNAFHAAVDSDHCILPLLGSEIVASVRRAMGVPQDERLWRLVGAVTSDDCLRNVIADLFKQVATEFLRRNGPRQINIFVEGVQGVSPLSGVAAERVAFLAEEVYNSAYLEKADEVRNTLRALKCPPQLVYHLRAVAISAIQEALAGLVAHRLNNSIPFKKTLKPD